MFLMSYAQIVKFSFKIIKIFLVVQLHFLAFGFNVFKFHEQMIEFFFMSQNRGNV